MPLRPDRPVDADARRHGFGRPDANIAELGRIDLVFKDGIAYDPKCLLDPVCGKIGRQATDGKARR